MNKFDPDNLCDLISAPSKKNYTTKFKANILSTSKDKITIRSNTFRSVDKKIVYSSPKLDRVHIITP